jgi:prepilin-type N-terminal cleavage/methylation domain-containing protein
MQHNIQRMKQDNGFTLIELLIVIIVIGILAGIAIFATGTFADDASEACDRANSRIEASARAAAEATGDDPANWENYVVDQDGC